MRTPSLIAPVLLALLGVTAISIAQPAKQKPKAPADTTKPASAPAKAETPSTTAPSPFAVVELFTSEGCSSCPPADKLAAKLVRDAAEKHQRVFVLAYHVDYWDYIGWKDPFASAENSQLQRRYSTLLKTSSVYTPQMIVNGTVEFVGSDSAKADREITSALKRQPGAGIEASGAQAVDWQALEKDGVHKGKSPADAKHAVDVLVLPYKVTGESKNASLYAALVERGLSSKVTAGENNGKTLEHDNVVRARVSSSRASDGSAPASKDVTRIDVPAGADLTKCSVILYLQEKSGRIIAAAEVKEDLESYRAFRTRPSGAR